MFRRITQRKDPAPAKIVSPAHGHTFTPAELADSLQRLADWLEEHAERVYQCDCDETGRGYMEYDTNAYIHGDDCPVELSCGAHSIPLDAAIGYFRELTRSDTNAAR